MVLLVASIAHFGKREQERKVAGLSRRRHLVQRFLDKPLLYKDFQDPSKTMSFSMFLVWLSTHVAAEDEQFGLTFLAVLNEGPPSILTNEEELHKARYVQKASASGMNSMKRAEEQGRGIHPARCCSKHPRNPLGPNRLRTVPIPGICALRR